MKTASQHHQTFKVALHGLFFAMALFILFAMFTGMAHAAPSEADRISQAMKAIWDSPEAPLIVEPVVIEGDYALAGWTQQTRGGRALLLHREGTWHVHVCGGDGLKDIEALTMAGMSKEAAERLINEVNRAEGELPMEVREKFSTFGQNILVDKNHHAH